jgi:hypothetical protein
MSTITATTASASPTTATTRTRVPSWRFGLATGVLASAATTVVVVAARAAGVPPEVDAESIPILGFVQMVLLGTVIGIVMARRMRTATFVRATVVLTALSCVPSLALGTGISSKLVLVLTHLVAAAVVVPRLSSRMDD